MKNKTTSPLLAASLLWLLTILPNFAGIWTPEDLGDRLWLDWWQEDLANGSVASWTTRKGSVAATQGTAANQPSKASGEVFFANGQRLNVPAQSNACLAHRALVLIFRIDLTGSGDGTIFAANGVTGGNDRQPMVSYNRNTNVIGVSWKTPNGYNGLSWTVAENASQWHCLVSRRVGNMHYASLDGQPELSVTMADNALPRNPVAGYIGDFRTSTPQMAIDSVMLLQDELSFEDAQKIQGWAMWRKGLQASLPAGHPYKDQPPMQGNGVLTTQDIGSPLPAGTTAITTTNFTLTAGGSGLGSTSDSFTYASQNITGDSEIIVKVDSLTNTSASAKAGIMVRGTNAANAPYVGVFARPGTNGVIMQWRTSAGAASSSTTVGSLSLPRWLKLTRTGNSFTASQSADGSTWSAVNTVSVTLPKVSLAGLAATSAVQSTATTAVLSNLTITDSTPVATFVESTAAEYTALQTFWNDTTQSEAFKGTDLKLVGWKLDFEDNFDTHTVTNEVTGDGPWYSPTHGAACGAATAVIPTDAVPQGSPATYIQASGEMTIRMQKVGSNWKSGVFCSVNSNGYGRTWMYPYIEARMKATGGNGHGSWPALWIKSENYFFNLTQSYLEYDIYEGYVSDNDGYHNSYHNWPASRILPGRLSTHRWLSNYLGLNTPGWYQNVNLFDNAYHTYGVMVTPEWVITMFDGKETFRFPTPVEMKQPMWTLVDLALGGGSSEVAAASGTYDLTIDYIKVFQNPAFSGNFTRSAFDGGAGSNNSDEYPGIGENGWAGAWVENNSTDITATVTNTNPLVIGGGNYLSILNGDTGTTNVLDSLIRQYSAANGVDPATPHVISFDYRLDSPDTQLAGNDAIVFFNNNASTPDTSVSNGYVVAGALSGTFQWRWYNGNKAGSGTWVDSGMNIVTGTVYHFTIAVDPANKNYTVSINNGTTTVTSGTMGYRTAAAAPASLTYLVFGSRDVASGQTITQSLDNVTITPP